MRILITQSGENIFNDEERREIMDKKFRSTTTNKIYRKKLTIEKFNKRKDKKAYDEKNIHKNYFIPAGISYKPDDFFSKTSPLGLAFEGDIRKTENDFSVSFVRNRTK